MVQDTSGDVIFRISFFAIACLPEENEVLDGKVIEVTGSGIQVQSGPIKCFISMKVNKANSPNPALRIQNTEDSEFQYENKTNQWICRDEKKFDSVIEKDTCIRYRVLNKKFINNEFVSNLIFHLFFVYQSVVGVIHEDYLGITKASNQ